MNLKNKLLILLITLAFIQSQEIDVTQYCQYCDSEQSFLRGYFIGNQCYLLSGLTKDTIKIFNFSYKEIPQKLPVFWSSDGLMSTKSFCYYMLTEFNQLLIKIFDVYSETFSEYLIDAKEIKHFSSNNDKYLLYIINMDGNYCFYTFQNDALYSLKLTQIPKLFSLNMFVSSNDNCLYQIVTYASGTSLICEQIFCYEEEIQGLQSESDGAILIWTKDHIITFVNSRISQILPLTNIVLIISTNSTQQSKFLDLSEQFPNQPNLQEFNRNYETYTNQRYVLGKIDSSQPNDQVMISTSKVTINDLNGNPNSVQTFLESTNNTNLYLAKTDLYIQFSLINEKENEFTYYQMYTNSNPSRFLRTSNSDVFMLSLYQCILSFIFSTLFVALTIRRYRHRKEIIVRIEDLVFQQTMKISKMEFERKYKIDFRDSLGCGSFGEVYKVKNKHKDIIKNPEVLQNMPDYYACKQLFFSGENQNSQIQVHHEIDVLEKLKKYDHVIKLQNYIIENRSTLLILDLAESTLEEEINDKQINFEQYNEAQIVKFLTQIGNTLAMIYSNEGITHCDIKPSNILLRKGDYYLSDFGCAQEIYSSEQLRNNVAIGTLKWMSPEVREWKHGDNIDFFKSDVFSLGMVLLYMLTLTDISQVNSDEFNRENKKNLLNRRKNDIHEGIILLVKKMLEISPDNRPDASILKTSIENIEGKVKEKQQKLDGIENSSPYSEDVQKLKGIINQVLK